MRCTKGIVAQRKGTAATDLASTILGLNPVAYWKLDETSGTTAVDATGNGHNGTYSGAGYTLAAAVGPDGNYLDVGNSGAGYVAVPDNNVFSIGTTGELSVVALMKPDSLWTSLRMIVSKFAASNYEWAFYCGDGSSGELNASTHTSAGASIIKRSSVTALQFPAGDWSLVHVTFVGVTSAGSVDMTIDGGVETAGGPNSAGTVVNGTAPLWIGWRGDSAVNQDFLGGLAHVAIFDRDITTATGDDAITTIASAATADGWI